MAHALEQQIRDEIKASGVMRLDRYMELCLGHYYGSRDPLGQGGDFTTAPEVSQMFGEILGAWVLQSWMEMGAPERFVLLELGPGRGTLMADMLRVAKPLHDAVQVHLLEMSPVLRKKQAEALQGYDPQWHEDLKGVPDGVPMIVVANEFFDALPIRQEVQQGDGWIERTINADNADLEWNIVPSGAEKVREISPVREGFMARLAARMEDTQSVGLVIDYGHARKGFGDTLQAVKGHDYVDPLEHIGEADLTAHVDFEALAKVAAEQGVHVEPLIEQGAFLKALGIEARASYLKSKGAENIEVDLERLVAPDQMGKLFKVMVLKHGY